MADGTDERWQLGDLTIDVGAQSISRGSDSIALPQLSFDFLLALVRAAPKVLSIDALMDRVWKGIFVNSETVTQRAKLLRDALGDDPKDPRYFTARRGAGYQMVAAPVRLDGGVAASRQQAARRWKMMFGAVALGLAATGGLIAMTIWPHAEQTVAKASVRVAVLPFDNLSSDPSDAFIARGIPEMVLNRLSSIRGLTVIARDSALFGPASSLRADEAGRQLRAGYIVKGSVQRIGDTLRVTCFVVDTAQGVRLWSEQFDWPVDRLYALQDRIAERVATSLETKVRGLGPLPQMASASRNSDAYLAYLKGKSLLSRFTVAETDAAAAQFERAIRLDPDFGEALVALFDAKMQGADLRKDDLAPFRARYQLLLDQALRRNPDSGPGLFAKAMWSNLPAAEREKLFRRAAELDPSNTRGLTAFAELLEFNNTTRYDLTRGEGQRLMDKVLSIDPLSPRTQFWAVQRQLGKLTPAQAEAAQRKALELDPQNQPLGYSYATRRWMFHGETAEVIERIEKLIANDPQNPLGPYLATVFYLDAGDARAARAVAATTPASADSTRYLLAQAAGDWRGAGLAAMAPRGFLFNALRTQLWAETVRDFGLHSRQFDRAAETIATRYGFDLDAPAVSNLQQEIAAPALAHVLLAAGKTEAAKRLLVQNIRWVDQHPKLGLVGVGRNKAAALMLLGEQDQALSLLTATVETGHDLRVCWYLVDRDPVWAPVRGDPRFKAIAEICRQAARLQREKLDALRRAGKVPERPPRAAA